MGFYIIIISISLFLFAWCADKSKKTVGFWFCYTPFILLLSFVGGGRALDVGTDLQVYGQLYFQDAKLSNDFVSHILSKEGEWGFHAFMWLCSRLSPDIHVMLFLQALVKLLLVSWTAIKMKKRFNPVLFMVAYLCFSYVTGFNIMRQAFATSFVIFSFPYLLQKRWIPYVVFSLIAMTMHSSAFVALLILLIYFLSDSKFGIWVSIFFIAIIYVFSFAIMNYLQTVDLGIYSEKASLYLEREGVTTAKSNILIAILYALYACIYRNVMSQNGILKFFISLVAFNLFFVLMSSYFEVAVRLSWYILHLLNMLFLISIKQTGQRKFLSIPFVSIYILYFVVDAAHGLGGCLPYKSTILNF